MWLSPFQSFSVEDAYLFLSIAAVRTVQARCHCGSKREHLVSSHHKNSENLWWGESSKCYLSMLATISTISHSILLCRSQNHRIVCRLGSCDPDGQTTELDGWRNGWTQRTGVTCQSLLAVRVWRKITLECVIFHIFIRQPKRGENGFLSGVQTTWNRHGDHTVISRARLLWAAGGLG